MSWCSTDMDIEMLNTYIIKTIFIYFTKNCDDITGTESQFSLSKKKYLWNAFGLLYFFCCWQQNTCPEDFPKHQMYWGLDEFEMLCFLLQMNVMHPKHKFQDRIATHGAHLSCRIFEDTQTKHRACRKETKPRRGDAGSGNAWGAIFMITGDRGHLKPTSSFVLRQTGKKETHTEQTLPSPPRPHSPPHSVCCPHTVSTAVPIERWE